MNRTDRLLAIVIELQARGRRRAEDLAATFEVGKRTIYRDIQALCEAGVPIVSTPGQGYSLVEGYFLPPLRFSTDEALMLLLGGDLMAQSFDAEYRAAAQSAGRKILGVLPEALRDEVRGLQASIRFIGDDPAARAGAAERLRTLRRAIVGHHTLRFGYHTRLRADGSAAHTTREADPYGLVFASGIWFLVAHDHLRGAIRHFRVDRIGELAVLSRSFTRPAQFALEQSPDPQRTLVVRALFEPAIAAWVREEPSFYAVAEEQRADGLLITFKVRHERELLRWLLGWGAGVRVLEPDSLRALLAAEAERMWRGHSAP